MPELGFRVTGARPHRAAGSARIGFQLAMTGPASTLVHSVLLRCQVRVQPARRRYSEGEQQKLIELFGTPDRWGQTLRELPLAHVNLRVPSFTRETAVELPVVVEPDGSAVIRYLDALEVGEIPLSFLFSGSVFYEAEGVGLQVAPISWDRDAAYRLEVAVWKEVSREAVTP